MASKGIGNINRVGSATHRRQTHSLEEHSPTPYTTRSKPIEMTRCPECRVVFKNGRWQWLAETTESEHQELCPACKRIRDHIPAGILTLNGRFFTDHRDEIMHLVNHKVTEQQAEHPMNRLMATETGADGSTTLSFTDMHLPRSVGEAIKSAYQGVLDIHYADNASIFRVYWQR